MIPAQIAKEMKIVERFVRVFCRHQHGTNGIGPCGECLDLIAYARKRLEKCPYDPKPKCKHCPTHCYRPDYRARMRAVMKFSGMHFVKRGRLDWLIRYFLS
ncbi:MAG: nitrous oxide-stimulated promoter family protein [Candidatus Sumerlaeia bacterium]|nr:nitrous oxide-stimulated promoter family protein [Candidatus Sumerlaeia bacterium]